jgi:hypothetical protein
MRVKTAENGLLRCPAWSKGPNAHTHLSLRDEFAWRLLLRLVQQPAGLHALSRQIRTIGPVNNMHAHDGPLCNAWECRVLQVVEGRIDDEVERRRLIGVVVWVGAAAGGGVAVLCAACLIKGAVRDWGNCVRAWLMVRPARVGARLYVDVRRVLRASAAQPAPLPQMRSWRRAHGHTFAAHSFVRE